jgi:hypothetical protein
MAHDTKNPLTVFLYLLLRDYMTAGQVEDLVRQVELADSKVSQLSNVHVAAHAEELAGRLMTRGETEPMRKGADA